jgi:phosphate transport system protein
MEDISNHSEAQIQDDCIWSISKNEPLANHLRYLIAIINSSKDLERMSDYAVSAMRFFVNNKIPDDIRILIVNIMHDALSANAKVNQSLKTKAAIDTYKTCQTVYTHFRKQYDTMLDALSTILKKSTVEQIESLFRGAIIIIKHIERLMDHVVNIAENFMFIKQPDLFFTKQSKQVNK